MVTKKKDEGCAFMQEKSEFIPKRKTNIHGYMGSLMKNVRSPSGYAFS